MARVSPNNISDLTQDWSRDEANGLPFSGASVQSFIKSNLGVIPRAAHFDVATATMYWFKSEADKAAFINNPEETSLAVFSVPITLGSDLFRINVTNNVGSTTLNVATNQTEVELSVGLEVQTKTITESIWTGTNSGIFVTAQIDPGASGTYDTIHEPRLVTAGGTYTLDVRSLLIAGANRVRLQFVDEDDSSIVSSITYTINMTEMFIEPLNNRWYLPIIEGGDSANYQLGGFRIVGALSKMLHIDIFSGDSKVKEFTYNLGTSSYDQVPFFYTSSLGFSLSTGIPLTTGVYYVSAYITSGTGADMLVSAPVNYNIMYITAEDVSTAQLVCINDVEGVVYNYTTSTMFKYSIYNKGLLAGSPAIQVKQITGTSPTTIVDTTLDDIACSIEQSYEVALEWLTEETLNLSVRADMQFGNSQTATATVDNSATFPPTFGFNFYLNSAARANSNANRLKIVNQANNSQLTPTWTRMSWVDGADGWTVDDTGRKCLYLPAGSKMVLPYSSYKFLPGEDITFEICYRVTNVTDYNENVITIMSDTTAAGFRGIRIRPTNILVHSSEDSTAQNDLVRGTNVMDEEVVHFTLTIYPNFKGNTGRNLVTGYVNGCKNFQFSYNTGALWETNGNLIIGAEKSDISLYFIRTYGSVLSDANVQANYINSLQSIAARSDLAALMKSVMDANGTNISYESVKNHNKNFFVLEMTGGASVPSRANGWTKDTNIAATANLEMHFGEHPSWDWRIEGVETMGQGTTSMGYYRWNLRWRIDKSTNKKVNACYLSSRTERAGSYSYTWGEASQVGSINFDGTNHPALKRMTAKINFASSMQSHKIGATLAYTELHNAVGLENDAQTYADSNDMRMPSVAVYEYPAYGFTKIGNEYIFIGLFTIGPDKGDKPTFGFDINSSIKNNLITLEGSDHNQPMVMFNHPWNENTLYSLSDEFINIMPYSGSKRGGWEVGDCMGVDTKSATAETDINAALVQEFKPAYDIAYNNSTVIVGIPLGAYGATAEATLDAINGNITAFQATLDSDNRITYYYYQFWIEGEYVLYYYDSVRGEYVAGVNLVTDLGTPDGETVHDKNEWFKARRRERFVASAENYWDIQDALYHMAFIVIIGAMDNFGKNTYPYKMKTLANGGRWKWRQDDLDSILGIGNAGADNMPAWMEFQDSNNGSVYFGGSPSVFWNLIYECYYDDYVSTVDNSTKNGFISMGRSILSAMPVIAGGANVYTGIKNYFQQRFWDNAQEYFPQSAYNADAAFKYEAAWLANDNQQADPLTQSLGNHYLAEKYWVLKRVVYMMSLFRVGPFGGNDANLGQIAFRPQSLQSLTLTPSTDLYPAFGLGQGMAPTGRTRYGDSFTFVGPFGNDGQTTHYINATDYLSSLGDLKDLRFGAQYVTDSLNVNGKKLTSFKIGDEDAYTDTVITPAVYYTQEEIDGAEEGDAAYGKTTSDVKTPAVYDSNVKTNVTVLSFNNTPCLETIDARNASSISGSVDLSACRRLRSAYFEGTSVTQLKFADGQTVEVVHYPDTINVLVMKNLRFLTNANLRLPESLAGIQTVQIQGCPNQNAYSLLKQMYNAENSQLQFIGIQQDGIAEESQDFVGILGNIADNKDKDGNTVNYGGVTSSGAAAPTASPMIEGTLQLTTGWYEDDFSKLTTSEPEDYGEGLKKVLVSNFGALNLIYNPALEYIRFADDNVFSVALQRWGDGVGVLKSSAAAVTDVSNYFYANTSIETFDEFKYFTGLTYITGNSNANYGFAGCSNLVSITLPDTVTTLQQNCFRGCTKLSSINLEGITTIGAAVFYQCPGLDIEVNIPNLTSLNGNAFRESGITKIVNLGLITDTPGDNTYGMFYGCANLTSAALPNSLVTLGNNVFRNCSALTTVTVGSNPSLTDINSNAFLGCSNLDTFDIPTTVTTIGNNAFYNTKLAGVLNLPNLTSIGNAAFFGTEITRVDSLGSVTVITGGNSNSSGAFRNCTSLESVIVPSTVTSIGMNVFLGCTALETLIVLATTPPSLGNVNVLLRTPATQKIYVPYSADHSILAAYQSATNWSTYASRMVELDQNGNIPT